MSHKINPAMAATLATLPLDITLSISAFLSNPLDVLSLSHTCRSAFLASQAWASYWSKSVPVAHLSRPAPWHSYSPSELRDAHIRYAATHRRWESPLPTFKKRPLRLQSPPVANIPTPFAQHWRLIRGTRWAWSLHYSTGEVSFCDLRTGLVIGKWSVGGPVIDAFIESRSPNECVLCHWETNQGDNIGEFEIVVATLVTFEQENLISPIKLSFKTTQKIPVEKGISISVTFSSSVLWRDYWIGSYVRAQPWGRGLFLWSITENSIFYFEMKLFPHCTKLVDDVLFVSLDVSNNTAYCCIHMPSLVVSTLLPGGSLSLTKNAVGMLLPKFLMGSRKTAPHFSAHTKIYSIPACPPTHPRYCFIVKRSLGQSRGMEWEVFDVGIDLSTPGPIKTFSRISWQYTEQRPAYPLYTLHDSDDDLLLYLPLGRRGRPLAPPSVRFLRVGKPDKWRVARLGGVDTMRLTRLIVDRDAGYVVIWAEDDSPPSTRRYSFIWWLDERKPGKMVYSRTKELISSWGRGLKWRF